MWKDYLLGSGVRPRARKFWWVVEMKEDTELEEGEAFYYKDDDEDNIDPDSFSYIVRSYFNIFWKFSFEFAWFMDGLDDQ